MWLTGLRFLENRDMATLQLLIAKAHYFISVVWFDEDSLQLRQMDARYSKSFLQSVQLDEWKRIIFLLDYTEDVEEQYADGDLREGINW